MVSVVYILNVTFKKPHWGFGNCRQGFEQTKTCSNLHIADPIITPPEPIIIAPEITPVAEVTTVSEVTSVTEITATEITPEVEIANTVTTKLDVSVEPEPYHWEEPPPNQEFQVLYFLVNGIIFGVLLEELGGIHRLDELNHLIGRPDWYLGLQTNRHQQYDVVDTAEF